MPEPAPMSGRVWMYLALGFVVFWIVCLAFFVPTPTNPLENTGISTPASYDWSLVDLNDQPVSFAEFKGKTVFLNLWATWCGPCLGEMPSIAKLAQNPRLRGKKIAFVCVSTDSSTELVRQFVSSTNWPMTVLRCDKVPQVFYSPALPTTFVIAPDGRIAAFLEGAENWDQPDAVEFLEKLASTSAPNSAKSSR